MRLESEKFDPDDRTRDMMIWACGYGFTVSDFNMQKYGTKIDTSTTPPSTDLIAEQLLACRITWEMTNQSKPTKNWLFFCYGHDGMSDFEWNFKVAAYGLCPPKHDGEDNEYRLAQMALRDYKKRVAGQPYTPEEVLIASIGSKKWAWEKHYKAIFNRYLERIKAWDIHGVARVSSVVKSALDGD